MADELSHRGERERVCELGRELLERELTRGTGGNVSVRAGSGIAVSPSGIPYGDVTPEMVPLVDESGDPVDGEWEASNETPMHAQIYRERDDAGGIVHTHSPYASTFASLGQAIPATHYLVAYAGREVPVAGYAHPGTEELGQLAVGALGDDHDACLLQNHGVVALGEDGGDALETAVMVEYCAQVHYQALCVGDPVVMDDGDVDELVEMFGTYRKKGSDGSD